MSEPAGTETKPIQKRGTTRWAFAVGTFFGSGRLKPGPGTWGSVAALLLWAAANWVFHPSRGAMYLPLVVGIALTLIFGVPAATIVARESGIEDPGFVVIDEVAGQWIALLFVPLSWKTLLVGFILFRSFDIVKPPPARQLERLPEGTGIVMDDVAAGAYALLVMQLVLHFRLLSP